MSEQEQKLDLPEWARWVTKDAFGRLFAHEEKPFKNIYCGAWYPPAGKESARLTGDGWEKYLRYVTWDQEEPIPITRSKNVIVIGSGDVVSHKNKALETVRDWMHEAAEAAFENSKMPDDSPDDAPAAVVDGPDETDEDEEFYAFLRGLNWKRQ